MPGLVEVNNFMKTHFDQIKQLPVSFKPKYICRVVEKLFNSAMFAITQMKMKSDLISNNEDPFI